jgi:hypothetical protein
VRCTHHNTTRQIAQSLDYLYLPTHTNTQNYTLKQHYFVVVVVVTSEKTYTNSGVRTKGARSRLNPRQR